MVRVNRGEYANVECKLYWNFLDYMEVITFYLTTGRDEHLKRILDKVNHNSDRVLD